jgi:ATP-dependent Clp protease adaptor protein ClpS
MSGLDFLDMDAELGRVSRQRAAGPDKGPRRGDDDRGTTVVDPKQESKAKLQKPKLWKVLLHNDNYTTRDFVVYLLQTVFGKAEPEAVRIMLHVHNNGIGVAGIYTYEVAETKLETTISLARQNEFPLMASMEPAEGSEE